MAADLFVVSTVTFRLLYVLIILAHDRRPIVHVAVTEQPTTAWTTHRNAFSENESPEYLLHNRDSTFADVASAIAGVRPRRFERRLTHHSRTRILNASSERLGASVSIG